MVQYKSGIGSSGAYMISGRPWILSGTIGAGEVVTLAFPAVTKSFTVYSLSADVEVYFNSTSPAANRLTLASAGTPHKLDVKCRTAFLSGTVGTTYQILAELTGIGDLYILTGSGVTE